MPNLYTLQTRYKEIAGLLEKAVDDNEKGRITNKQFVDIASPLNAEAREIGDTLKAYNSLPPQLRGNGGMHRVGSGDPSGMMSGPLPAGMRAKGSVVAPLRFSDEQLKGMFEALQTKSSFQLKTKGFESVDSDLPAQLQEWVVGPQYEPRLLDRLPAQAIEAPSLEYIIHNATTGSPGIVAEGQPKPELLFQTEPATATVAKLAAHTAISWEIYNDWGRFTQYCQQELVRQVVNTENNELLNGPGGAGNIAGILSTSGILTHDASTDNGTNVTALDSVEMSIAQLRTGPALAEADLLVLHPNSWSALRRIKDAYGHFMVQPDPTAGQASELWGIPVLQTTQIAAGTGVLLDTRKFGFVVVREALTTRTGTNDNDFISNLIRFICEERLQLAIERPSAVLAISGLPTS
ncbi:hypothetical protein MMAN_26030 [Mycobacterium mantenii]|uniref:Phage capsid-like C-terminal domain-containing protein n=1 Tax=Mycobacterium mantenii TaxID=560555 RepID=A0A1X0G086_MYCNT|nr:phage major capsid protein [Mycobacterium mantenii]MCV7243215.1 phage major capsid protein [Mycobacterium mantenii]ORB07396.1 hypothetical protein BST30_07975 [Mycobacterium mantenii]BBY38469.1 hypothetical protein MMAN_26030 [Mycobacterium mantenii]